MSLTLRRYQVVTETMPAGASGNWTMPNNVLRNKVLVEMVGEGSPGSGGNFANNGGGSGGGAGASKECTYEPGTVIPWSKGDGQAGRPSGNPGTVGTPSNWNSGEVIADGGNGGAINGVCGLGGTVADSVGDTRVAGNPTSTSTTRNGGAGASIGSITGGAGGQTGATAGQYPGGGGMGGTALSAGTASAGGIIKLTYTLVL